MGLMRHNMRLGACFTGCGNSTAFFLDMFEASFVIFLFVCFLFHSELNVFSE